jgi:hypothetical protein
MLERVRGLPRVALVAQNVSENVSLKPPLSALAALLTAVILSAAPAAPAAPAAGK